MIERKPATFMYPDIERGILSISPFSCMEARLALNALRLPEHLTGLRLLEVGSGSSDITAELVERGVDAYAIDPVYENPVEVLKAAAYFYEEHSRHAVEKNRLAVVERFIQSLQTDPFRYIAASATAIPFPDGHFDMVFSINAVTVYLDHDFDVLSAALKEMLRVTKPGGTVQLDPYREREVGFDFATDNLRLKNQEKVFGALQRDRSLKVSFGEVANNRYPLKTIIITKR